MLLLSGTGKHLAHGGKELPVALQRRRHGDESELSLGTGELLFRGRHGPQVLVASFKMQTRGKVFGRMTASSPKHRKHTKIYQVCWRKTAQTGLHPSRIICGSVGLPGPLANTSQ